MKQVNQEVMDAMKLLLKHYKDKTSLSYCPLCNACDGVLHVRGYCSDIKVITISIHMHVNPGWKIIVLEIKIIIPSNYLENTLMNITR
jgi:hypothetical protein